MTLILLSANLSQNPDKVISTESIQKGGGATSETGKSPAIGPTGSQPRGWSGSFGWTSNQMDCFPRTISLFVPIATKIRAVSNGILHPKNFVANIAMD